MAGNVIHIFGASGSGTLTIGQYICKKCGYYFMDTDNYFWELTDRKGSFVMRSKKHDFWQKKLHCSLLLLDGSLSLKDNFEIIKRNLSI